ncbi:MAG: hypothetical protein IPM38_01455 [Ignavibacteria bacterium]|nr:hypothetical protein [Ignavibacteria bacterium]
MKHKKFKIKHLKKRITIPGLTLLILLIQHTALFAQSKTPDSDSNLYPTFLLIFLIALISSIFIGLEILDDPKYESQDTIQVNHSISVSDLVTDSGNELYSKLKGEFSIAYYFTGVLLIVYGVILFVMY